MEIKIVGKNSSNRNKLFKNVKKAIKEVKSHIDILLLEDKTDEIKYGVTNTPSLVIDDKVISQGRILNDREIVNYIKVLS